ncbi:MAG: DUF2513 domain-containing protein [Pseudomonadota bacterium]|nr:DUF2513 domain-containing protein [Pseudomonadota bacterium]
MKRNWDVIREVLIEVESLESFARDRKAYGLGNGYPSEDMAKSEQALLLWKAGFLSGIDAGTYDGPAVISPELTWEGHDLLDTLRSKTVWERIKKTATDKGIELTFDAVKLLGKSVLEALLRS